MKRSAKHQRHDRARTKFAVRPLDLSASITLREARQPIANHKVPRIMTHNLSHASLWDQCTEIPSASEIVSLVGIQDKPFVLTNAFNFGTARPLGQNCNRITDDRILLPLGGNSSQFRRQRTWGSH